jgi:hypothetical protein
MVIYECKNSDYYWPYVLSCAPIEGRLLALPTNIKLHLKGLPGTNTIAYKNIDNLQP